MSDFTWHNRCSDNNTWTILVYTFIFLVFCLFCWSIGSSGTFSRSGIHAGRYRIRIEAVDRTTMQRTVVRRRFAVHGPEIHCSSVLINDGITIHGSDVTAEFQGRGNGTHFACILDREKNMEPCKY